MASVSPNDLIVMAAAALVLAALVGLAVWARRYVRRRSRRRSSRAYAKSYFNESLTREQIAAAAREQRERLKAKRIAEGHADASPAVTVPASAPPTEASAPAVPVHQTGSSASSSR